MITEYIGEHGFRALSAGLPDPKVPIEHAKQEEAQDAEDFLSNGLHASA